MDGLAADGLKDIEVERLKLIEGLKLGEALSKLVDPLGIELLTLIDGLAALIDGLNDIEAERLKLMDGLAALGLKLIEADRLKLKLTDGLAALIDGLNDIEPDKLILGDAAEIDGLAALIDGLNDILGDALNNEVLGEVLADRNEILVDGLGLSEGTSTKISAYNCVTLPSPAANCPKTATFSCVNLASPGLVDGLNDGLAALNEIDGLAALVLKDADGDKLMLALKLGDGTGLLDRLTLTLGLSDGTNIKISILVKVNLTVESTFSITSRCS
jgi:hypothetical protein